MIKVGSFEAKTHFSQIIQKVSQGEEFLVTKNGKPVARIVAIESESGKVKKAIQSIITSGQKRQASHEEIKGWIKGQN